MGETLSVHATGKCQPWAHVPGWVPCLKPTSALGQGWAHGGLKSTSFFAPAKPQILSNFLYGDYLFSACGAKHLIWCRSTSEPLRTFLLAKTLKYWRHRVNILWGHIGLYKTGCHNLNFTIKTPHDGHNPAMLTMTAMKVVVGYVMTTQISDTEAVVLRAAYPQKDQHFRKKQRVLEWFPFSQRTKETVSFNHIYDSFKLD